MTLKAFKYRFYPTPEQESLLRRTMGCTRLVYNLALAARTEAWYERQERVGYLETNISGHGTVRNAAPILIAM
jgi:putative transposase